MFEFIEFPLFSKYLYDYLTDEEYGELQQYLNDHPDAGDLVKGSGGVRKLRWARSGTGKSGGVRVLHYARTHTGQIWLLLIYAKSVQDSIPSHVIKALKQEIENADD